MRTSLGTHLLDSADCAYVECGEKLCKWDGRTEDSEEIDVIVRSFVLKKHRRQKYRCKCGAALVTAGGSLRLPGGGLYSINFAIEVVNNKYWLHLPLERQARDMVRQGLDMSTSTLWDQIEKLARVLSPVCDVLMSHVLDGDLVHADEARWSLLKGGGKTWWVWSISRGNAVYYKISPSRGHQVAVELIDGFKGVLMVDDDAGYQAARKHPARCDTRFMLGSCSATLRRPRNTRFRRVANLRRTGFAIISPLVCFIGFLFWSLVHCILLI